MWRRSKWKANGGNPRIRECGLLWLPATPLGRNGAERKGRFGLSGWRCACRLPVELGGRPRAGAATGPGTDNLALGGTRHPLPTDLTEYLRGLGACVLNSADLQAYVLAAESTWTTEPWVLEARTVVIRLQRVADELAARSLNMEQAVRRILVDLDRLQALVVTRREARGLRLRVLRRQLEATLDQLMNRAKTLVQAAETDPDPEAFATKWAQDAAPLVHALDNGLREWHRSVDLGA